MVNENSAADALRQYLADAAPAAVQRLSREPGPQHPELEFPNEMRTRVEALLRDVPELQSLDEMTLRTISGGGSISFDRLAISVLERLSWGNRPEEIIADLLDFVQKEQLPNYYLAGIGGIALPTKLKLDDRVSIISADDIPPNWAREFVFRIDRFGRIVGSPGHEALRPQAALMITNTQQVLIPPNSPAQSISMNTIRGIEQKVILSLTLASDQAAPVLNAKTSWIDHPAQSYHGLSGGSGGTSPNQLLSSSYASFDTDLVVELFKSIDRLSVDDQTSLFLAGERLRRSRLHESPVDRAIDLGIAFEVILLGNTTGNQELRYRSALHGAFLMGNDEDQRRLIFETLRAAYDVRSIAVHSGKLDTRKQIEKLPQGDELARKIAIKLIRDGGFPDDWESMMFRS